MKTQNIYIAHPNSDEQASALKAFMKALKIKFEVSNEKSYNPAFVNKVLEAKKDIEAGRGIRMTVEELKALCK
jgi:hypothetical protein